MVPDLRNEHDAPDLLDAVVVYRRHAVQIPGHLRPQVRDGHELREDIFREHVRVAAIPDVVAIDVDVVRPQMKIRRGDGPYPPVRLGREGLLLVPV